MNGVKLIVRWTDKDGDNHRKEYTDEKQARKAKAWLEEHGATNVDVAVRIGNRETAAKDKPGKPVEAQTNSMFPL